MTTYIPFSLFEQCFPDDESLPKKRSTDHSNRAVATEKGIRLRTKVITTYPEGRIVVGRASPKEIGDDVVELIASQVELLPFYRNGDLLAIEQDLDFVRDEMLVFLREDIFAEGEFSKRLFSGQSGGIDVARLLRTKLRAEGIAPAHRSQYKLEMATSALCNFLCPGAGYASLENRENWRKEALRNKSESWIEIALRNLRHYVVTAIEPGNHLRRGSGDTANSNDSPIEEYVRIENALAQIYCLRNGIEQVHLDELMLAFTAKPHVSRKAIDAVQPTPEYIPTPYLGDLAHDLRECLANAKSNFGCARRTRKSRRPKPPLPKYYGAKKTNLLCQKYMNERDRVRAGLVAYAQDIDDCEETASKIIAYQFDIFMYEKQVKKVNKGKQFRSYLPKDGRVRPILDKINQSAFTLEDREIVQALMTTSRRSLPPLNVSQEIGSPRATAHPVERAIALAELTLIQEWIYRDANELDIPERLVPWADECSRLSSHEKEEMLQQLQVRVRRGAQELVALERAEDIDD